MDEFQKREINYLDMMTTARLERRLDMIIEVERSSNGCKLLYHVGKNLYFVEKNGKRLLDRSPNVQLAINTYNQNL